MAGRLAGHQDVLGPGRACGESERGGTRPRPEGRTLARPLSRSGVRAGFWDVPAIREVVKIMFDVGYQSDSSYRLLLRLCGPSLEPPDPFDEHRDEPATTRRAAWATTKVKSLSCQGWEVHTARLRSAWSTRPGPAACSPQKRTAHQAVRGPAEDVPVLLRRPPPDQQNSRAVPDRAEPGHLADDPRAGPAPTRNRGRQDRGRPGQRPPPPRQSPDRPPRARPAAGAHHHDLPAAVRARPPTRPGTSGTRPGTTPPPSSTRPPKKPSAHPPHTSPAEHSTTTPSTFPPRETRNDPAP